MFNIIVAIFSMAVCLLAYKLYLERKMVAKRRERLFIEVKYNEQLDNVLRKNLLGGRRINSCKNLRNLFSDEEVTHRGQMSLRLLEPFNIFLEEELYHLGRRNPPYLFN